MKSSFYFIGLGLLWALISFETYITLTGDVRLIFYFHLSKPVSLLLFALLQIANFLLLLNIRKLKFKSPNAYGSMVTGFILFLAMMLLVQYLSVETYFFRWVNKGLVFAILPLNGLLAGALFVSLRLGSTLKTVQAHKVGKSPLYITLVAVCGGVLLYLFKAIATLPLDSSLMQFILCVLCFATPFVFLSIYIADKIVCRKKNAAL